ncbi:LysM peptidoglycan-binding domain-containing protein, partial [Bacillus sp. D-CC]
MFANESLIVSEQIIYQVQPGDSLVTIAKRYNVTVQS